jgi:hypothetical protein
MGAMETERRPLWELWAPPLVLGAWIAVSVPFSVRATAWGLAVFCVVLAVARWIFGERSALVVRRRAVDVAILGALALAFIYLAWTGRFG